MKYLSAMLRECKGSAAKEQSVVGERKDKVGTLETQVQMVSPSDGEQVINTVHRVGQEFYRTRHASFSSYNRFSLHHFQAINPPIAPLSSAKAPTNTAHITSVSLPPFHEYPFTPKLPAINTITTACPINALVCSPIFPPFHNLLTVVPYSINNNNTAAKKLNIKMMALRHLNSPHQSGVPSGSVAILKIHAKSAVERTTMRDVRVALRRKADEGVLDGVVVWVEGERERRRGVRSSTSASVTEVVSSVTPSSSSSTRMLGVGDRRAKGREA